MQYKTLQLFYFIPSLLNRPVFTVQLQTNSSLNRVKIFSATLTSGKRIIVYAFIVVLLMFYECRRSHGSKDEARRRQDTHNKQHNASRRLDLITVMDVLCHQRSRCYFVSLHNSCSMCVQQAATILTAAGRVSSAPTTITTQL